MKGAQTMSLSRDEFLKLVLNNYDIKTAEDIQNTLKDLFRGLLNQMLESEMEQLKALYNFFMSIIKMKHKEVTNKQSIFSVVIE